MFLTSLADLSLNALGCDRSVAVHVTVRTPHNEVGVLIEYPATGRAQEKR